MHISKSDWVSTIRFHSLNYPIVNLRENLESPSFNVGRWRVAIEHQRRFQSVVIQWQGQADVQPQVPMNWKACPPSDLAKGWHYRVGAVPAELPLLLSQLEAAPISVVDCNVAFEARVERASQDGRDARLARLESAPKVPRAIRATTTVFMRNADVVVEVLFQAAGVCQRCEQPAPFNKRDGTPYLEVHHRIPLAKGGDDTVKNAIALCPNCHRYAHYA